MKKIISALLILTMIVSMVCVSASAAGVHINMNFESMDVFTNQFIAGAFYTEDNLLFGYAEAKALQSIYETDDDLGVFKNTAYTWLTYDATITLNAADDDLSETDRFVNLVYCNDNLKYMGREEDRYMMSFMYDMQEGCFRLAHGFNATAEEDQLMAPVYREIDTDGAEDYTLGISIDKDRMRCFYNDELIFDLNDTAKDYLIADQINSCFLFWQDGNFVQIKNITVADQGYLFPYGSEPVTSAVGGDTDVTTTTNKGDDNVTTTPKVTTTAISDVVVTDKDGNEVTDASGNKVTSQVVITEAPSAATNTGKPAGGNATATGDATFVVIAAMVATLGCALIVRKASVR